MKRILVPLRSSLFKAFPVSSQIPAQTAHDKKTQHGSICLQTGSFYITKHLSNSIFSSAPDLQQLIKKKKALILMFSISVNHQKKAPRSPSKDQRHDFHGSESVRIQRHKVQKSRVDEGSHCITDALCCFVFCSLVSS